MTAAHIVGDEWPKLFDRVEVLPGRLDYALAPASAVPLSSAWSTRDELFLCIDDELVYARFFADFGPLNLGQTVRFCQIIDEKLNEEAQAAKSPSSQPRTIVLVSSDHPHKRANVMNLLVLYLMMCHRQSPEQALAPFESLRAPFGFRDAACGICSFFITILDCARAVDKV